MSIPKETERKFIIKMPDFACISKIHGYTASDITQIYLEGSALTTHRIRKRVYENRTRYTETKKLRISEISVLEDEREISELEFAALIEHIADGTRPVIKRRHTFPFGEYTAEIDVYPEWNHHAIMEVELRSENDEIELPEFINVVKEVSGDKKYSNAAMSRCFPEEPF